jgi:hypothetical protein
VLLLLLALQAAPAGNLASGRAVSGPGIEGRLAAVTDGSFEKEGADASASSSAVFAAGDGVLTVDLVDVFRLRALVLQGSAGSRFRVESSTDGRSFSPLTIVPAVAGRTGLVTRAVQLREPRAARILRIVAGGPRSAVSELQVYAELPADWPPGRSLPRASPPLTHERLLWIKAVLGLVGTGFLFYVWSRPRGKGAPERMRAAGFGALGLLGLLGWTNFGVFHIDHFLHVWDFHGYYIGAKYFPELEYTRLYECTAAAEADLGHADEIARIPYRDLRTDRLVPGRLVVEDPSACKSRFSSARWQAFKADTAYFRSRLPLERWHAIKFDHGFNAPPAWVMTGRLLADRAPASDRQIALLAALDPLLIAVLLGGFVWSFGWRAASVAAFFLGTNCAADFGWIGGCFLRFDWLALTVLAICLLKKERPLAAGFLLGWAALLRVFPGFLFAGVFVREAVESARRTPKPRDSTLRFAFGGLLALAVLLPLSTIVSGDGPGAWVRFVDNSRKHLASPSNNNIGLKTALSWTPGASEASRPAEDTFDRLWERDQRVFEGRKPLFLLAIVGATALLALACRGKEDWECAVLAAGLVPFATTVSCYYSALFVVWAALAPRRPAAGVLLALLGAVSPLLALLTPGDYENYRLFSIVLLAVAAGIMASACHSWRTRFAERL